MSNSLLLVAQSGIPNAWKTVRPTAMDNALLLMFLFDIPGIEGTFQAAGLYAFVLAFDLNLSDIFASVRSGGKLRG